MSALWFVLTQALARGFYRAYAGWLTAAAFLLGGVMSGQEHKALILASLADWRVLAGAYLLPWTLYTLASMRYARRAWAADENEVLRVVWLVPPIRRWVVGLGVQALVLAPCWGYAAVIAAFALPRGAWQALVLVGISLTLLTVLGWAAHEGALRGPRGARGAGQVSRRSRVPPALWWLHEQLHAQSWGLLLLKAVSVTSIIGLCAVYSPATFDVRLLTLGGLITALLHSLMPGALYAWERQRLPLLWNQPLGPGWRLVRHAALFGVLLLPELLAWLRWCPLDGGLVRGWWALRLWALPVTLLLLAWASLLWRPVEPSALLTRTLPFAFAIYLLLMARVPLEVLTLISLLVAGALAKHFYWQAADIPTAPETRH